MHPAFPTHTTSHLALPHISGALHLFRQWIDELTLVGVWGRGQCREQQKVILGQGSEAVSFWEELHPQGSLDPLE